MSVLRSFLITLLLISSIELANAAAETTPSADAVIGAPRAAATRLAVVEVSVLLAESPRAKALAKEIKNKYLQQEQLLKKEHEVLKRLESSLDRDSDRLSNVERIKQSRDFRKRKRQYTRDYETFRDQLNTARQEALITVRQEVLDAIDSVREKQQIDIVIENYISASDTVDITPDVIDYLNENYQKEQRVVLPDAAQSEN
jgi:Skp family chaperone for outer membrane proteins